MSQQVMLNLSEVDPRKYEAAIEDFEKGNGPMFAYASHNHGNMLMHVQFNAYALRERGIFEAALCAAITGLSESRQKLPGPKLERMLEECDRPKLLAAGQELPGRAPFVVYRGISGTGVTRRVDGLSWTLSLDIACCCAVHDWRLGNPCVYKARVPLDEVYFYTGERGDLEVFCKPRTTKPMLLSAPEIKRRAELCKAARFAKNQEAWRNMENLYQDSEDR
jgi:hypothetical protein